MILFLFKRKGYKVFVGPIEEFKNMKEIIKNEVSPQKKLYYKLLLCSYYGSIILSILSILLSVLWVATGGLNH